MKASIVDVMREAFAAKPDLYRHHVYTVHRVSNLEVRIRVPALRRAFSIKVSEIFTQDLGDWQ